MIVLIAKDKSDSFSDCGILSNPQGISLGLLWPIRPASTTGSP
ncbi:hypothetical protein [Paracoccus sp. (in: a-proteobacteria)]|nr:hypothetical protein [Paracoccus sp. (in: a-proteobacteria)]